MKKRTLLRDLDILSNGLSTNSEHLLFFNIFTAIHPHDKVKRVLLSLKQEICIENLPYIRYKFYFTLISIKNNV